ncbi:MAG TPA: O-antigen ligase family protein [Allosphingosinicella sp.]|nr:O-antigen ligase family protein [Allosphingosinicella sp.]
MTRGVAAGLLPFYLLLCLLLGGASAAGLLANVLLQLLAIGMLFAALIVKPRIAPTRAGRRLLILLGLMAAVIAVQLVPLPPGLWTSLPGREPVRQGFELLNQPLPWLPLSLAPHATIASALWLLPAIAILVWILRHGVRESWITWLIVVAMVLSVLVGAMQITGGEGSPWYFYRITNYGVTVGFFANANHMATFLLVTVPFLGALYMALKGRRRSTQKSAGLAVMLGGLYGLVLVGLAINGSLAGLGLILPVTGATLLLMLRGRRIPLWAIAIVLALTGASVAAVFSGRVDNNLISDEAPSNVVSRYTTFTTSFEAIKDNFPVGSGVGTFQPIYRTYEDPTRVTTTYINHVHSDWIEIVLETGVLGLIVMLLFLAWWLRRAVAIWRAPEPDYFARAATIASAAVMAHSLVDYPLRTVAVSALFAVCCALMALGGAAPERSSKRWPPTRPARHVEAD